MPCATQIPAEDGMTAWVKRPQRCVNFRQGEDTNMQHTVTQLLKKTHIMKGSQVYSTGKSSSQLAHPERRLLRNAKATSDFFAYFLLSLIHRVACIILNSLYMLPFGVSQWICQQRYV